MMRYFPFLDLKNYRLSFLRRDVQASLAVIFLDIPQGVAYATIAGLPPVMGLYAAAIPAIIGALFRSSHHVVTGPSNALSLLVGTVVAATVASRGYDPMTVGITLALLVGTLQLCAGLLRLNVLTDYVSTPVVRGYISGAAILIVAGQLPNLTGTIAPKGNLIQILSGWIATLPHSNPLTVALTLGTTVMVLGLRGLNRNLPHAIIALAAGMLISELLHLHTYGLQRVADLAHIPAGLPPLTIPAFALWRELAPGAVACTVLSLVESSSVARSIAARTGQRLDMAAEFAGQGMANLAAAFSGGYPVSGSLARSTLNQQAGAVSRLSAVFCGLLMIAVLLFLGPLVARTPVASLAGLLLVLAIDLIDRDRIRITLRGRKSDRAAFLVTLLGTWLLPLDQAIYLGVGISLVLFLRRARLLTIREMALGEKGRFREIDPEVGETKHSCPTIRILNLTGPLFFAAAGELESALDRLFRDRQVRVLILRLRQAQNLDVTIADVLESTGSKLGREGKTLLLLGMRHEAMDLLEQTGIAARLGRENLFPAQAGWFTALELALRRALALAGQHSCGSQCPFIAYLAAQDTARSASEGSTNPDS